MKFFNNFLESHGTVCPWCNSENLQFGVFCEDSNNSSQKTECLDCLESWETLYQVSGIFHNDKVINALDFKEF